MLQTLSIKNYALLLDVEVDFAPGLNILTGETGAGKSILLGALGTILGDRVDTSMLRHGTNKAVIEGTFSIARNREIKKYLHSQALESGDGLLILRREIYDNGRSRAFINDTPVQLSVLQEVGDYLVDLHGQHEHQSLLKVPNHLKYIDEFGELGEQLEQVENAYGNLQKLLKESKQLQDKQISVREKQELYSFQVNEIENLNPKPEEEEALLKEEKIIQHSEKLFNLTNELYQILYDSEDSVFDRLSHVYKSLDELEKIDGQFVTYKKECASAKLIVEEVSKFFQSYVSGIEFNPERVEEIQNRISALASLKKKYGRSLEEILAFKNEMKSELEGIEDFDAKLESLQHEIDQAKERFSQACLKLSQKRREVSQNLSNVVPEILSYLGMPGSRFNVALEYQNDPRGLISYQGQTLRGSSNGMDFAEFMISTNMGEQERPLVKVASGGEISRIMLTLKSLLAKADQIPVLIFDEIDMGISGRIAQAVGRKLKELSQVHQVICITHLPQIASMGEHHFFVEKVEKSGRTETTIRKLNADERTKAIAKLLAGENISETHLKSAQELLQDAAVN